MAVVYFTSNASTGAGSLSEAVKNAQPGDVIRPDETVFERGSTIEIVLASQLTVGKNLTLDASPCRVRLDGGGARTCAFATEGVVAEFTAFDFVRGYFSTTGGCVRSYGTLTLNRCGVYGGDAMYAGGIFAKYGLTLNDCVVAGCRATQSGGAMTAQGETTLNGATIVGNVAKINAGVRGETNCRLTALNSIIEAVNLVGANPSSPSYSGCVVDVASSAVGFVAPPPDDLTLENWDADAWQNWDLRLLDDASPNPSPYRDSGDVGAMSRYDLQGNFRGRESEDATTCSPGAFETIQADLFWIGIDATGAGVVSPSFLASDGWASSRFATVAGDVAPTTGAALFVGETVSFDDAPPFAAALVVGANNVVIPGAASVYLTIGATQAATVGGTLAALKLGDYAELTPSTSLVIPAVEFGGAHIVIDNVSVEINDGVVFAAAPRPAAITTTGSGGWADTTVGVSALNVNATDAQTVAVSIVKSDANKAAFAQYSTDDGATWQTVATTAAVDEYSLTVPQGADVTVRAATATGWLAKTVSTATFLPVWTVSNGYEMISGVSNVFEIATGGSNDGLNTYDFNNYGYL